MELANSYLEEGFPFRGRKRKKNGTVSGKKRPDL